MHHRGEPTQLYLGSIISQMTGRCMQKHRMMMMMVVVIMTMMVMMMTTNTIIL